MTIGNRTCGPDELYSPTGKQLLFDADKYCGGQNIKAMKAVKSATGIGLETARDMVKKQGWTNENFRSMVYGSGDLDSRRP